INFLQSLWRYSQFINPYLDLILSIDSLAGKYSLLSVFKRSSKICFISVVNSNSCLSKLPPINSRNSRKKEVLSSGIFTLKVFIFLIYPKLHNYIIQSYNHTIKITFLSPVSILLFSEHCL